MKRSAKKIGVCCAAVLCAVCLGAGIGGLRFSKAGETYTPRAEEYEYAFVPLAERSPNAISQEEFESSPVGASETEVYITGLSGELDKSMPLELEIPETIERGDTTLTVKFVQEGAFSQCENIVDLHLPESVLWQVKQGGLFTVDNGAYCAKADGETATIVALNKTSDPTLILPSNIWLDDGDGVMEEDEPTYRYTEFLMKKTDADYRHLVVTAGVINLFNNEEKNGSPNLQGSLLAKSNCLETVRFATGRREVLPLYSLAFESCTALEEVVLSEGVLLADGARVFQGCTSLKSVQLARENNANVPSFYTLGADGALYTSDYAYSYYNTGTAGLSGTGARGYYAWKESTDGVQKVIDFSSSSLIETAEAGDPLTVEGDRDVYYSRNGETGTGDGFGKGIAVPQGSFVFDVASTETYDTDLLPDKVINDFAKDGSFYPSDADFESVALWYNNFTGELTAKSGKYATVSHSRIDSSATGGNGFRQDNSKKWVRQEYSFGELNYSGNLQVKKKEENSFITIQTNFDFAATVYFTYDSATSVPTIGLFGSADDTKTSVALGLIDFETHTLRANGKGGQNYYLCQPSDEEGKTKNYPQVLCIILTPVSPFTVKQANGEELRNGALVMEEGTSVTLMADSEQAIVDELTWRVLNIKGENEVISIAKGENGVVVTPHRAGHAIIEVSSAFLTRYVYVTVAPLKESPAEYATAERRVRYQTLVLMPPQYEENGKAVEYFDFGYTETVEIGDNAFQGTQITVIRIPDRIKTIGMNAFRFSDMLQTVYLPDFATYGSDIFGQDSDAEPADPADPADPSGVYTAGKRNFTLIAPSRDAYERYFQEGGALNSAFDRVDSGDAVFSTSDDPSHCYTQYLTYEITVAYDGDTYQKIQYLFGRGSDFVKASETVSWTGDNNDTVYFGHRSGKSDNISVQVKNTVARKAWTIAKDGWYSGTAKVPEGKWYLGTEVAFSDKDGLNALLRGQSEVSESMSIEYPNHFRKRYNALFNSGKDSVSNSSELPPKFANTTQTICTLPTFITLRSTAGDEGSADVDFDVPDFQKIGEVQVRGDLPTITVPFDFSGFPASRILSGIDSARMNVSYTAEKDGKESAEDWDKMKYQDAPYDAGTYLVTLSFKEEAVSRAAGGYSYRWSGSYNGIRVNNGDSDSKTFRLIIVPRPVYVSDYTVAYTGEEVTVYENNPYYTATDYQQTEGGRLTDLPTEKGSYTVALSFNDPKYAGTEQTSPNLYWADGIDSAKPQATLVIETEPKLDAPTAVCTTFEYRDAAVSLVEIFGRSYQTASMNATIERVSGSERVSVSEIREAGEYAVTVEPAKGYAWKEPPISPFTVRVTPKRVAVPMDSYIPDSVPAPYEFYVPVNAEYHVKEYKEYHVKEYKQDGGPKVEKITENGKYQVTLALNDIQNYKWDGKEGGEVVVNLYVGMPKVLARPNFNQIVDCTAQNEGSVVYDAGVEYIPADLFDENFIGDFMTISVTKDSAPCKTVAKSGTYIITIALRPTFTSTVKFTDGVTSLEYTLTVKKKAVTKPKLREGSFYAKEIEGEVYTLDELVELPAEGYTVSGWTDTTEAKDYPVTFTLKEDYEWMEGGSENVTLTVKITAWVDVTKPTVKTGDRFELETENDFSAVLASYDAEAYAVAVDEGKTLKEKGEYTLTFTLRAGYRWGVGEHDPYTLSVTLYRVIEKPSLKTGTFYEQDTNYTLSNLVELPTEGYTAYGWTDTGAAGTYTVIFQVDQENYYLWSDGTDGDISLSVVITPYTAVQKPQLKAGTFYERGTVYELSELVNLAAGYTVRGWENTGAADDYTVTFTLDDGYKWEGEGTIEELRQDYVLTVYITACQVIEKPKLKKGSFYERGTVYELSDLVELPAEGYTVEGWTDTGTANEYPVTFTLNVGYKWQGGGFEEVTLVVTITKREEIERPKPKEDLYYWKGDDPFVVKDVFPDIDDTYYTATMSENGTQNAGDGPYTVVVTFVLKEAYKWNEEPLFDEYKATVKVQQGKETEIPKLQNPNGDYPEKENHTPYSLSEIFSDYHGKAYEVLLDGNPVDEINYGGEHTLVVVLRKGYRWVGKTFDPKEYKVSVKAAVSRPVLKKSEVYECGTAITLDALFQNFNSGAYDVKITLDGTPVSEVRAVGVYRFEFTLKTNNAWIEAGEQIHTVTLTVMECTPVEKPTLTAGTFYAKETGGDVYTLSELVELPTEGYTVADWTNTGEAGEYPVTFTLKEGYKWQDGSFGEVVLNVKITAWADVAKPTVKTGALFELTHENDFSAVLDSYTAEAYTVAVDGGKTLKEKGEYTLTFTLNEGYRWGMGKHEPYTLPITLYRKIEKPSLKTGTFYEQDENYTLSDLVTLPAEGYSSDGWTDTGAAGTTSVTFQLKKDEYYFWSDGTDGDVSLVVVITPYNAVKKPTLKAGTFYERGTVYELSDLVELAAGYTARGWENTGAAGEYTVTFALDADCKWEGEGKIEELRKDYGLTVVVTPCTPTERPLPKSGIYLWEDGAPFALADLFDRLDATRYDVTDTRGGSVAIFDAAGEYALTFTLRAPYKWDSDNAFAPYQTVVVIGEGHTVDPPALKSSSLPNKENNEPYTAEELFDGYLGGAYTLSYTVGGEETDAIRGGGVYTLTLALNAGYRWSGEDRFGTRDYTVDVKASVARPVANGETLFERGTPYSVRELVSGYVEGSYNVGISRGGEPVGEVLEAGEYTLVFTLKAGNEWKDGEPGEPVTLTVTISACTPVAKPTLKAGTFYEKETAGDVYTLSELVELPAEGYSVHGWTNTGAAGEYAVTFTLDEGYKWQDGGFGEVALTVKITAWVDVAKPAVKAGSLFELADENDFEEVLASYDAEAYAVAVADGKILKEKGEYALTFTLNAGYRWGVGEHEPYTLSVTLYRGIEKPSLKQGKFYERDENYTLADLVELPAEGYSASGWEDTGAAGTTSVTFQPKKDEYYLWSDGTDGDVSLDVVVTAYNAVKKPTLKAGMFYERGTVYELSDLVELAEGYTVSGWEETGKAGQYYVTFTLKDGYRWTDGSRNAVTLSVVVREKAAETDYGAVVALLGVQLLLFAAIFGVAIQKGDGKERHTKTKERRPKKGE